MLLPKFWHAALQGRRRGPRAGLELSLGGSEPTPGPKPNLTAQTGLDPVPQLFRGWAYPNLELSASTWTP